MVVALVGAKATPTLNYMSFRRRLSGLVGLTQLRHEWGADLLLSTTLEFESKSVATNIKNLIDLQYQHHVNKYGSFREAALHLVCMAVIDHVAS
jgi:hypothetical protein